MRFIDEAHLQISSGAGGNGCRSFRHEKYIAFGGPDGGDGGRGGDIVMISTDRRSTLLELQGRTIWRAKRGEPGRGKQQYGKGAEDVIIEVPVGTRVFDNETNEILADLTQNQMSWVAAKGGQGGKGNLHFKTSTNRSPRKATPGQAPEQRRLRLELMLMADVGLLGFPNAGKSTLISAVSAAKPKVASYPFTTLTPSLGVVKMGLDHSFVIADIPGLVEGASDGTGLGHQFLRHVARTRVLAHLVSLGEHDQGAVAGGDPEDSDIYRRYRALREELERYDPKLASRPEIVVLTKTDLVYDDDIEAIRSQFSEMTGREVFVVCAPTGQGLSALKDALLTLLSTLGEE
jgi:GTP-binding protein